MRRIIRFLLGERRGLSAGERHPSFESGKESILISNSVRLADISFYQGNVDFHKMKSAGVKGIIIRAGQRSWEDERFRQYWQAAKNAGLPRASYWFYDSRSTPESQAALWWSLLRSDPPELFVAADYEEKYGGPYGDKSALKKFILEIQARSAVPNEKIFIYTGYYWWGSRVGNDPFFGAYPLWLAWYAPMNVVKVPLPWRESDLILWQHTSSGDGRFYGVSSAEIDLNWYFSDEEDFHRRFGLGPPPPQGEKMQETHIGTVTTLSLKIRSGPGTQYPEIYPPLGGLRQGDKIIGRWDSPGTGWFNFARILRSSGQEEIFTGWASAIYGDTTAPYVRVEPYSPPSTPALPASIESTDTWRDEAGNILAVYRGTLTRQE